MYLTEELNLKSGHNNIEFVDVDLNLDTELYLDPALIECSNDQWCIEANEILNNYFENVFDAYANDRGKLNSLFKNAKEPNETFLGQSSGKPNGKGNSEKGLIEIFEDILNRGLVRDELIKRPMDLCVFVKGFAEDGMSDLVTNILRGKLNEFTLEQCKLNNIPVTKKKIDIGYSWNSVTQEWEMINDYGLEINGKKVLMVPKRIVSKNYMYSIDQYINKKILEHMQKVHIQNQSNLTRIRVTKDGVEEVLPPSKKKLRKEEIQGTPDKEFATNYTKENINLIEEFRKEIIDNTKLGRYNLNDEELDEFIYE